MSITVSVPSDEFRDRLPDFGDDVEVIVWDFELPQPEQYIDLAVFPYTLSRASREVLSQLDPQRLGAIQSQALGYDGVDDMIVPGITYCNAVDVHEGSTAELVVGLILASTRGIDHAARAMPEGRWQQAEWPGLRDSTVLLVGYGGIGTELERRLSGFETTIVRCANHSRADPLVHATDELPRLLPAADVVVVGVPLTDDTEHMIDDDFLSAMRPGALVVNVSRGRVADSDALVRHAASGYVRVALDVTDPEPLPAQHRLWTTPGVLITPHLGGAVPSMHPRVDRLLAEQVDRIRNNQELANIAIS